MSENTNIILYTDNGCDLDLEVLRSYNVRSFHMPVTVDGVTYRDRIDIDPPTFYRLLEKPGVTATTAQITPGEFVQEFQKAVQESDAHIIYIAFSSGLSATYESACLAREEVAPDRITVIDSKSASVGQALTVIRAANAIKAGKSKEEVIAEIEDNIKRIQHFFVVGNFEMLKRGGRVSGTAAAIGNLLNVKLILTVTDGKILPYEKVRGLKKALRRMLDIMEEKGQDLENQLIGINHSNDLEGALELKAMIQERFGCQNFVISEIGAVIGAHVGANTYSVFFLT